MSLLGGLPNGRGPPREGEQDMKVPWRLRPTGSVADHRLPARASDIEGIARALHAAVTGGGAASGAGPAEFDKWVAAAAKDLQANRGAGVVVAGDRRPPAVHAIAQALNAALGNAGTTVIYTDPVQPGAVNQLQSLRGLVDDMNSGKVDLLVILGGNPVYTAPADLKFGEALKKVATRVHLGLYDDETSAFCHWHIPETHYLEQWSDVRAVRRHRVDRAAGDRSVVPRALCPRGRRDFHGAAGAHALRRGSGTTGKRSRRPRARTSRSSGGQ